MPGISVAAARAGGAVRGVRGFGRGARHTLPVHRPDIRGWSRRSLRSRAAVSGLPCASGSGRGTYWQAGGNGRDRTQALTRWKPNAPSIALFPSPRRPGRVSGFCGNTQSQKRTTVRRCKPQSRYGSSDSLKKHRDRRPLRSARGANPRACVRCPAPRQENLRSTAAYRRPRLATSGDQSLRNLPVRVLRRMGRYPAAHANKRTTSGSKSRKRPRVTFSSGSLKSDEALSIQGGCDRTSVRRDVRRSHPPVLRRRWGSSRCRTLAQ